MTDPEQTQHGAGLPEAIGIISGLKGFLVWIGGSIAGMTAILYVCGYLITTAHIYTLGLHGLVDFSKDYFLLEGAKFFLAVGTDLGHGLMHPLGILAAMVIAPFVVGIIFARQPLERSWRHVADWYAPRAHSRWATAAKFSLYSMMLITGAVIAFDSLQAIFNHLQTADLLYHKVAAGACDLRPRAPREALVCEHHELFRRAAFKDQLWGAIKLIALACVAWRLVGRWRLRAVMIAPFVFFMAFVVLMLPMDFGALLKPTRYPVIRIQLTEKAARLTSETQFLIDRTDKGFTIWDPSTRHILWIPLGDVAQMETIDVRDLFAEPKTDTAPGGEGI